MSKRHKLVTRASLASLSHYHFEHPQTPPWDRALALQSDELPGRCETSGMSILCHGEEPEMELQPQIRAAWHCHLVTLGLPPDFWATPLPGTKGMAAFSSS